MEEDAESASRMWALDERVTSRTVALEPRARSARVDEEVDEEAVEEDVADGMSEPRGKRRCTSGARGALYPDAAAVLARVARLERMLDATYAAATPRRRASGKATMLSPPPDGLLPRGCLSFPFH